jgi:hypothetical protein
MKVYLVRIMDGEVTTHPRELVGIFAAQSIESLCDLVDQCTDPNCCEYRVMGEGGIMWSGPAPTIPPHIPKDDEYGDSCVKLSDGNGTWDELWFDQINRPEPNKWRRLVPPGKAWTLPIGQFTPDAAE